MGMVYAGEHPQLGKRVALKILRPELSLREDIVERFIQEARAVNTIGHSNIVNIYDFGRTPFGSFYIVMEFLDGQTIRALLEASGPQPLARVRKVVLEIGAALAAAHAKGFIHRDVKPENIILVSQKGREQVKLLDFGIAKLLSPTPELKTMTGAGLGTPQYMSPEQLEEIPFDQKADVYAFGAVIYEMLTGQVPYPGKTHAEVRQLQLTHTPTSPSVLRKDTALARTLDGVILWALSLDQKSRCPTIEELIPAFQVGYERTIASAAHSAPPKMRPLMIALGLFMTVVITAGSTMALLKWMKPASTHTILPIATSAAPAPKNKTDPDPRASAGKMLQAALNGEDPRRRALAAEILGVMGHPAQIAELRAAAQDKNPQVSRKAALALGNIGDKGAIPALRKVLQGSMGFKALDIAAALAQLGAAEGITRLRRELKTPRTEIHKKIALHALGKIKDPSARGWKKFIQGNRLVDNRLKLTALGYLAALGDEDAKKRLHLALKQGSWKSRITAAKALSLSDVKKANSLLLEYLAKRQGALQLESAYQLACNKSAKGSHFLVKFLKSKSSEERYKSTLALGMLGQTSTRGQLAMLLGDLTPKVALAAAAALSIPGK